MHTQRQTGENGAVLVRSNQVRPKNEDREIDKSGAEISKLDYLQINYLFETAIQMETNGSRSASGFGL